jgi:hypothetical protein
MPTKQRHRGRHPADTKLFAEKCLPAMQQATAELSYLLTRGYAHASAAKLVGDHHQLTRRQRQAVARAAAPDHALARRRAHATEVHALVGRTLAVDGFNILITTESLLSGGILLHCRDGCVRDMASLHGSYRNVEETVPALRLLGATFEDLDIAEVIWYLDAPVSNSGRLKTLMGELAAEHHWPWRIEIVRDPDRTLAESTEIVVTSDSAVLDHAERWFNLLRIIIEAMDDPPPLVNLAHEVAPVAQRTRRRHARV